MMGWRDQPEGGSVGLQGRWGEAVGWPRGCNGELSRAGVAGRRAGLAFVRD